jgi:hypothetical protein
MRKIDARVVDYFLEKHPDDDIEVAILLARKSTEGARQHFRFAVLDLINAVAQFLENTVGTWLK